MDVFLSVIAILDGYVDKGYETGRFVTGIPATQLIIIFRLNLDLALYLGASSHSSFVDDIGMAILYKWVE